MPLFDGLGRSAEARALEVSTVVEIPYEPIRDVYEARPRCCGAWSRCSPGRIRNMDSVLADSVFLDVTGRTAKRLLELAGDEDEFAAAGDPGGAGRHGRCVARAGEQGDRLVRPARLDRAVRPPLPITDREQLSRRSR